MNAATLEVRGLSCSFGTRAVVANASLRIDAGERVALVGGNGLGKTTLLRALLGLHPQAQGMLHLDGRNPGDWRAWRRIAFVPQRLISQDARRLAHCLLLLCQIRFHSFPDSAIRTA